MAIEVLYLNPANSQYEPKDLAWLTATFGGGLKIISAGTGPRFALVKIVVTKAEASFNAHVLTPEFGPKSGQPIAFSWKGLGVDPNATRIRQNGVPLGGLKTAINDWVILHNTDDNGQTGYGVSEAGWYYTPPDVGPGYLYPLSPSLPSDTIEGLGMIPGTVHYAPTHVYWQEVAGTVPVEPPVVPPADGSTVRGLLMAAQLQIDDATRTIAKALGLLG